jgi:hypothetical protein
MTKPQLIFIDESGDPGLTGDRSSNFVVAAVVIIDDETDDIMIRGKMKDFKRTAGLTDQYEFKFSKTRKDIVKNLIQQLTQYNFKIYGVILDKENSKLPNANSRYSLYNSVLVELLRSIDVASAKICIDGEVGKKYKKNTTSFLRHELNDSMHITNIRYADSQKVDELQLADIVAGAINRSLSNKKDAKDYLKLLKDKIVEIRKL